MKEIYIMKGFESSSSSEKRNESSTNTEGLRKGSPKRPKVEGSPTRNQDIAQSEKEYH